MRASTPVSWPGRTTWPGTATRPVRAPSLYQCTRKRFRGSASSAAVPASESRIPGRDAPRRRQLAERGQQNARLAEPADGAAVDLVVGDMQFEPQ